MTPSPIIVCGLPRCGSSLTMQMLSTAGIRCIGTYPAYEVTDEIQHELQPYGQDISLEAAETFTPEFMANNTDAAIKLLDPHRISLPTGFKYRFIFLTRSRRQQCYSQLKMLRLLGELKGGVSDTQIESMKSSLAKDEKAAFQEISKHEGSTIKVRFEDIISHPDATADRIKWFLDLPSESVALMARVVRPRSVRVYNGMLELDLMDEMKGDIEP